MLVQFGSQCGNRLRNSKWNQLFGCFYGKGFHFEIGCINCILFMNKTIFALFVELWWRSSSSFLNFRLITPFLYRVVAIGTSLYLTSRSACLFEYWIHMDFFPQQIHIRRLVFYGFVWVIWNACNRVVFVWDNFNESSYFELLHNCYLAWHGWKRLMAIHAAPMMANICRLCSEVSLPTHQ